MNLSNHDLVLCGLLRVLPPQLERFVRRELSLLGPRQAQALGTGREAERHDPVDLADLSTQIRVLTARGEHGRYVFTLPAGLGPKLHEVRRFRNGVVHGRDLDSDQALAALVAVSETLRLINASADSREEIRELIHAIDGGAGRTPAPPAPVHVEVIRCPRVIGYAHAAAGLRLPVDVRLTGGARPDGGSPARARGTVEARLSLIEHDGARQLTEPRTLTFDCTVPEPTLTAELTLDRESLLQVASSGGAGFRVELRSEDGWTPLAQGSRCHALAPRQWQLGGGAPWAGPALATFVQPDDGAVEALAHEALRACLAAPAADEAPRPAPAGGALGEEGTVPGVQAPGPDALVDAVCAAVRLRRLTVRKPSQPWRARPHRIATPTELLESAAGTTLDVAVLLAAVLERLGLAVTLALTDDNALVAYDRTRLRPDVVAGTAQADRPSADRSPAAQTDPASAAPADPGLTGRVTRVAEGQVGLIDPQLAARSPLAVLHRLSASARRSALAAVNDIVLEVPLAQARKEGAAPQPHLERQEDDLVVEHRTRPRPTLTVADVGAVAAAVTLAEDTPTQAEDARPAAAAAAAAAAASAASAASGERAPHAPAAVEEWKRHLLDLSARNPLIRRDTHKTVELMVPHSLLGSFEDLVNRVEKVLLRPAQGSEPDPDARRAESLLKEERAVEVDLPTREYRRRLGALAAEARVGVEETGANNLYLALGTLTWSASGRRLHSPLVLVPVTLKQDEDAFYLLLDQAGVSTPNYSLLARFAADTGIDLEELREPARDEHGIDVDAVLTALATRLRRQKVDACVEATTHLGLFRFSTYRMWEDLNEHWAQLGAHPLVSRLAGAAPSVPTVGTGLTGDLDAVTDLDELTENLPLDADASQAEVVARAAAGHSLVVEGPPGTGKSQTVVNLIFHALRQGRTVMFVAEKASALDVVARRLREEVGAGIGSLLLNLHDNSVSPGDVREALRRALAVEATEDHGAQLDVVRARLSRSRARLQEYRRALHGRGTDEPSYYETHQALVCASGEEEARARAALGERARAVGLQAFDAQAHTRLIDDYRDERAQLRRMLPCEVIAAVVRRRDETLDAAGQRAEELRHEIGLRRSPRSIRELMSAYGDLVTAITPCLLVSPDSVARFLPVGSVDVDLVVFDEASQITVPGAVGSIGRGRSTVVVGDRKQMPPPPAAHRGDLEGGADGAATSILDRCEQVGVLRRNLSWHYRSQVESLIAFSNKHYYGGDLRTFPGPLTLAAPDPGPSGFGVSWRRVHGRYYPDKVGAGRARRAEIRPSTNPVEAHEVVEEVLRRFEASADRIPSLGVLTLNVRQRDLIEDMLRERGSARVVEALDARDGLLVRNLDNIQGEERDTVLFSLTFSANERGDVPLNFGSLNHEGGQRRLNVAITRARRQMVVFSSFDPEDLHAERSAHRGVKDLRRYLEMARSGRAPRARLHSQSEVDVSRDEIAQELRACGLEVRTGVGHSSFAIDLVLAPAGRTTAPGVAVLLDGPGWNRRGTVADRDLLPVDVLRRMGWSRVERVWLPQWVADPRGVCDRLISIVEGRPRPAAVSVATAAEQAAPVVAAQPTAAAAATAAERAAPVVAAPRAVLPTSTAPPAAPTRTVPPSPAPPPAVPPMTGRAAPAAASPSAPGDDPVPERTRGPLTGVGRCEGYESWQPAGVLSPGLLDEAEKDPVARARVVEVAQSICDVESPLTMRRLVVKLCRAFGLSRTTASREARVRSVLGQSFAYIDEHDFVWRTYDASLAPVGYRRGALDHVDSIEEIHPRELASLMADVLDTSTGWDSPDDLYQAALRRLSGKKRKLGARGVKNALRNALKTAEATVGE